MPECAKADLQQSEISQFFCGRIPAFRGGSKGKLETGKGRMEREMEGVGERKRKGKGAGEGRVRGGKRCPKQKFTSTPLVSYYVEQNKSNHRHWPTTGFHGSKCLLNRCAFR